MRVQTFLSSCALAAVFVGSASALAADKVSIMVGG
jgi:hypothetical protein